MLDANFELTHFHKKEWASLILFFFFGYVGIPTMYPILIITKGIMAFKWDANFDIKLDAFKLM